MSIRDWSKSCSLCSDCIIKDMCEEYAVRNGFTPQKYGCAIRKNAEKIYEYGVKDTIDKIRADLFEKLEKEKLINTPDAPSMKDINYAEYIIDNILLNLHWKKNN